ncbi:TetR/AcrR family transcriptional regulator [Actinocorallia lasiicapitis]
MGRRAQEQHGVARELLLDVAERLMSEKGYAATPVSAICKAAGVAPTSLYWHFGSKEGLLATVMERGADRWFAALPRWSELPGDPAARAEAVLAAGADAVASHPVFLRLFYTLAIEGSADPVAAELVQRVRAQARSFFRDVIAALLFANEPPELAAAAADDLAGFAVAFSDGCFFASQLEPGQADLHRMYADLATALTALAPAARARAARTP